MPRPHLVVRRLIAAFVLAIAVARSGYATHQFAPACATAECTNRNDATRNELWLPATQIHEIKNQFVDAIRQFTEAAAGRFGDEGPRLRSTLDAAGAALARWNA